MRKIVLHDLTPKASVRSCNATSAPWYIARFLLYLNQILRRQLFSNGVST